MGYAIRHFKNTFHQDHWLEAEAQLGHKVREINRLVDELDTLEKSASDHWEGHTQQGALIQRMKVIIDAEAFDAQPLAKLLEVGNRKLEYVGIDLLRQGNIVPRLKLARLDLFSWDQRLIISFGAGSNRAFERFSPASPYLLSDATHGVRIDCSHVFPMSEEEGWEVTRDREAFAAVSLRLHNFLERNGYSAIGKIAQLAGLSHIISLIRVKLLADWLVIPPMMRGRRLTEEGENAALSHLVSNGAIRWNECLDPAIHALVESEVGNLIERGENILNQIETGGGISRERSRASIQFGMLSEGVLFEPLRAELTEFNSGLSSAVEQILALLVQQPDKQAATRRLVDPVDIADLEGSGARRTLAVSYLQEIFADFHNQSLAGEYDKWMIEYSGCPMPYSGVMPLEQRVKASVGAQLIGDFQKLINEAPAIIFDVTNVKALESCSDEQKKAVGIMLTHLQTALKHAVVFLSVKEAMDEGVSDIFSAWLSHYESRFFFKGAGISDLGSLIAPVIFFSDARFEQLIRHESSWLSDSWKRLRMLSSRIPAYIHRDYKNWFGLRENVVLPMIQVLSEMGLKVVAGDSSLSGNTAAALPVNWREPPLDIFRRPPSFPHKRLLNIVESSQPVEVVDATPGSVHQYQALVRKNAASIRCLSRALDNSPRRPRNSIVHAQNRGPLVDPVNLRLSHTGQFWRTVRKTSRIVPQTPTLALLMDFSGSMGQALVDSAKDMAISLAEAFSGRASVVFYLYTTGGAGYRLIRIMDGRSRGMSQIAAIAAPETRAGTGWNPDAACLLALLAELQHGFPGTEATICHISDFELCRSLAVPGLDTPDSELHYAIARVLEGAHTYIAARVGGKTDDPIKPGSRHHYLHLGAGNAMDTQAVTNLLKILRNIWEI